MAKVKQGFYGREYIKDENGDYDYQAQVNRLHNLVQWDRHSDPIAPANASISLDEMQERWKAYDWLIADNKHFEDAVIKKVDEINSNKHNITEDTRSYNSQRISHHIRKIKNIIY